MVAAMVLVVQAQSGEPEWTDLNGRTARSQNVRLTFLDGKLRDFDTGAAGYCGGYSGWVRWNWSGSHGQRAEFDQDGSSFRVREQGVQGRGRARVTWVAGLRGELVDDGRFASGTVYSRWRAGRISCEGRVRFKARRSV